ncbi:polysaccharide deacetylase family protein [Pontibacter lucknowensis]|uniref:Polysaccharide deacetylase n=1 Tax=Pontibacter lucknowensis TaxID=1077936 RepID=A0A1N7AZF2_9BACT|nr:polysaccharide deacetylase family protein [Pontibacter lucknowensis]SIR44388.1 Polysaccharide deacetylase [Pontibacter lucknowensis]
MIRHFIQKYLEPKALVLMYHRIAAPETDIWDLAVSPANFEEQLQVLSRTGEVVPLHELAARAKEKRRRKHLIALSFDDGYIDNYETAKPLLEKYRLPATFFVTSCNLGTEREFWWDELENLILHAAHLPATFVMKVKGVLIKRDLKQEAELSYELQQQHMHWKACLTPPTTRRSELFLALWTAMRALADSEIQQLLQQVRDWTKSEAVNRPAYKSMSTGQLAELAKQQLFAIGAHTVTHPALGHHGFDFQKAEMAANRDLLQELTGNRISLMAYPYGHYNADTLQAAEAASFDAAFTTEGSTVNKRTHQYRIGRFQVNDMTGAAFAKTLQKWALT